MRQFSIKNDHAVELLERISMLTGEGKTEAVVAGRTTADPIELLDVVLRDLGLEIAPLTATQAEIARRAYLRYGKGQGDAARLNYGDVMSYALAVDRGDRLAFVGDDFHHTDADVARLLVRT